MAKHEPREWQEFTQKAMDLAGLTQVDLGRLLTKKLGRQITPQSIHSWLKSHLSRAPREEAELTAWADALKLDGQHRETFVRLALMESTPLQMRLRLTQIESDLETAQRRLKAESKRSGELAATVAQLSAELEKATIQATSLVQQIDRQ